VFALRLEQPEAPPERTIPPYDASRSYVLPRRRTQAWFVARVFVCGAWSIALSCATATSSVRSSKQSEPVQHAQGDHAGQHRAGGGDGPKPPRRDPTTCADTYKK
jgi:hypothetical protein